MPPRHCPNILVDQIGLWCATNYETGSDSLLREGFSEGAEAHGVLLARVCTQLNFKRVQNAVVFKDKIHLGTMIASEVV